jgi:redox-sensitive bicupin YhaK (pirin superfamily)
MITLRPSGERGRSFFGWLDSRHTFSFGDYLDPDHMGFRTLRVINDDRVEPGQGFGTHPHRDMEILSIVVEGALEHRDSMGNGSVIRAGEVQRMTAGTGVTHSEFNPSPDHPVRFLQVWILPERRGLPPEYQQAAYPEAQRRNALCPVASSDARGDALFVHQRALVLLGHLESGAALTHRPENGGHLWLQLFGGAAVIDGHRLADGDGAAVTGNAALTITGADAPEGPARFLLFDLA